MNKLRHFNFEAVRSFDDAILKAVRQSRIDDVLVLNDVRNVVFDMIDQSQSIEELEDKIINFMVADERLHGPWKAAADVIQDLSFRLSFITQDLYESMMRKLSEVEVHEAEEEEEPSKPSDVAAKIIDREMDRVILNAIQHSSDIGTIKKFSKTVNAVREDLLMITALDQLQHNDLRSDLRSIADLINQYMNERRAERLGVEITQVVHYIIDDILRHADEQQSRIRPSGTLSM